LMPHCPCNGGKAGPSMRRIMSHTPSYVPRNSMNYSHGRRLSPMQQYHNYGNHYGHRQSPRF
jgi:hypothetical protein